MNSRRAAFFRAYRSILLAAGGIGILLPLGLIAGDKAVLKDGFEVRGSVSSYYYSPLRDLFVGSLCVIGVLLITYEWPGISGFREWREHFSEQRRLITEFGVSSLAGLLLLIVAFCPTEPPSLPQGNHCKIDTPPPAPCTALQERFGDTTLYHWHIPSAITALCLLLVLGVFFAFRAGFDTPAHRRLATVHYICAAMIFVGLIVAAIGIVWDPSPIGPFKWIYSGEVIALLGFGFGWVVRGFFLSPPPDSPPPVNPAVAP